MEAYRHGAGGPQSVDLLGGDSAGDRSLRKGSWLLSPCAPGRAIEAPCPSRRGQHRQTLRHRARRIRRSADFLIRRATFGLRRVFRSPRRNELDASWSRLLDGLIETAGIEVNLYQVGTG